MKLTLSDVTRITRGVVSVIERDGKFEFMRFTPEELEVIKNDENKNYIIRANTPAGVRLAFVTDANEFSFSYECESETARKYAFFDIYVNGNMVSHFGYKDKDGECGSHTLALPGSECEVEVYLPWSSKTKLHSIELVGSTKLVPIFRKKTVISYGDSITQGFDAEYPSLTFFARIGRMCGFDGINKGIGGYHFNPEFSLCPVTSAPDFVTVAYGINDWSKFSREEFEYRCREFLNNLRLGYRNLEPKNLIVITPIRYRLPEKENPFGAPAYELYDTINRNRCDGCTVINGWDFLRDDESLYADEILHPNDEGFALYADAFYRAFSSME